MSIEFSCACGQAIAVPDQMAGKKGKCPSCGTILDVPMTSTAAPVAGPAPAAGPPPAAAAAAAVVAAANKPISASASATGDKPCPMCGETIRAAAVKCRFCGEFLDGRPRSSGSTAPRRTSNYSVAPQHITDAANMALVLGIISFVIWCPITAPIAIIKGNEARRLAKAEGLDTPGAAIAGLVLGWIITGLTLLFVIFFVFIFVLAAASAP